VLVITYRPDAVPSGSPLALALGDLASAPPLRVPVPALTRDGVARLAAGSGIDAAELFARTGGNAFFVSECLSSGDTLPATVREAVLARVHRLPPAAVTAAQVVSIFPGRAEASLVDELGATVAGVDAATEAGVLVGEPGYVRFRHELARAAVQDSLTAARRRSLNRAALQLIEARTLVDPARATHHAMEAGDIGAALRHAPDAARAAELAGARREAIAHLELAVQVGAELPVATRRELLVRLADHCEVVGRHARAIEAYRQALALTEEPRGRAEILLRLWNSLSFAGHLDPAAEALDQAIELLEGLPPGRELALGYAQRCSHLMLSRRLRAAEPWGRRAMALAAAHEDVETLAYTQIQSGIALFMTGDDDGLARVQDGIDTARRREIHRLVAHGLSQIGSGGGEIRRYDLAIPALRECIGYAEQHELGSRGLYSAAWLGRCLLESGRWDEATALLTDVLRSPRAEGVTVLTALTALGRLRARRGDPDLWRPLDEALELATRTGHLQRLWPVTAARAEAAWLEGRLGDELDRVLRLHELARGLDQPWATGELALWASRGGAHVSPDGAAEPFALSLAGRAAEAAACWQTRGCPYERADALAHSGEDRNELEALGIWQSLGARPAARWLTDRRRAAGRAVPRGPNASTRGNAAGLTGREVEILQLVAQGLRNPQIAERLHLSPKTVSHHVSHVLAKLGAGTRTEAASIAVELGLVRG
jgi:DNA-binding CsgD family transcriptional regulator/tetratricopeptide (TPR) repeat protein